MEDRGKVLGSSVWLEFRTYPGKKQKKWRQTEKAEKSILYSDNRKNPQTMRVTQSEFWRRLKLELRPVRRLQL